MQAILNFFTGPLNTVAWLYIFLPCVMIGGVLLTVRTGFIQFRRFGYAMKNTAGKMFKKMEAGAGAVTPLQAVTTALAATVGTGNIVGTSQAIALGGYGAVFWLWLAALMGMVVKYSEVTLSIHYRQRDEHGDWVGGPMYYIKNGLGKNWKWLGAIFCIFGALAAFGIGNMTQVNTIANAINNAIDSFGGNTAAASVNLFGQIVPISSIVVGVIVAVIVALTLFGGIKRIGSVTERLIPFMAIIYIVCALCVVICNFGSLGKVFAMIFKGAFSAQAALGGAAGITIMTTIQKGVGRGVFSNEAGLGSAPIAHAATSEKDPVKQGLYGIFEVFMDTILICTLTALTLLCGVESGVSITWGESAGAELISAAFATAGSAAMQRTNLSISTALSSIASSIFMSMSEAPSSICFAAISMPSA